MMDSSYLNTLESMFGLPTGILSAVGKVESNNNPKAVSPKGAMGQYQIMPATARDLGVNPMDPEQAAYGAASYLRDNLARFDGNVEQTIAAYNAGPGAVQKYSGVPPYQETQNYVARVQDHLPPVDPSSVKWDDGKGPDPGAVKWDDASAAPAKAAVADTQPGWQVPNTGLTGRMLMGAGDFLRPAARAIVSGMGAVGDQLSPGGDFAKGAHEAVAQMDAQTASQNAKFATKQQAEGKVINGTDWVRTAAGIAPAFLVPAGRAATWGGRVLMGMGGGAILGAASTKDGESYGTNVALGAATGGAGAGLADLLGRGVRGAKLSPEVKTLVDQGVTPTPGQALGGWVNSTEQRLSSVPLAGDAVTAARRGAVTDMNRALYQQVLDPIGEKAPTKVGREAVDEVYNRLSSAYEDVLPNVTLRTDTQFRQDMGQLVPSFSELPETQRNQFNTILNNSILNRASNTGVLDGDALKQAQSALNSKSSSYQSSPDPDQRNLADLLRKTQDIIRQALIRQNPDHAPRLQAIDSGYSRYAVLREAAQKVNNPEAPIMPGQLQQAIRSSDTSRGNRLFGAGKAKLQAELGDPAMKVLGNSVPDSGTAARAFLTHSLAGALGGSMVAHPGIGLGMGALAAAYGTPLGRQAMFAALARRPDIARALGGAMQGVAPQIGGAAALYGVNGQGQ